MSDLERLTYQINGAVFEVVGDYFADIVVEKRVILELKTVDSLQKVHEAQLLNYLKATGYRIGLLVNFTYPKAEIKRFIL